MGTQGELRPVQLHYLPKRGVKACNSAETRYLCLLKGLSNVIFSSTVALSSQGFCEAYATDPLFLGGEKNRVPSLPVQHVFLETIFL